MTKQKIKETVESLGIKVLFIRQNKVTIEWKDYLKTLTLEAKNLLSAANIIITIR